eukprot:Seg13836.1 transcript_id=Seg13836.1/GoldUCD/mRNA.D3Y31 product="UPF0126 membrane protein SCO5481" protein_id=Seg13836.1/GoldUCD/D3Y31
MLLIWDIIGTFFFCVSGALAGQQKRFDYWGIFLMALITGTGGGTLRSILIGDTPPPILTDPTYIIVAAIAVPVAMGLAKLWKKYSRQVSIVEALGLGIFACIGARVAIDHGLEWWAAMGMGAVTASFGGVIRDIIRNELPLIFRKEIYATAALVGAGLMMLLDHAGLEPQLSIVIAAITTAVIRLIAIKISINASEA